MLSHNSRLQSIHNYVADDDQILHPPKNNIQNLFHDQHLMLRTQTFLQSSRPSCNPTINLQQSISSKIHTQLNVPLKRVVIGHKLRYSSNGLDSSVKKKCIHDSLYDKNLREKVETWKLNAVTLTLQTLKNENYVDEKLWYIYRLASVKVISV
uniref:CSON014452 protein n=1 Tax=Culicoides sonorensis TaxID=179676 RepID=A0A336MG83_CULSO